MGDNRIVKFSGRTVNKQSRPTKLNGCRDVGSERGIESSRWTERGNQV